MASLTGDKKEKYLSKIELAISSLAQKTRSDPLLDRSVYPEISQDIEKLATTFRWLRVLDNEQDYHNNRGIYTELRGLEGGMPNMLDITSLNSDKNYADMHLSSIAKTSDLLSLYGQALIEQVLEPAEESGIIAKVREEYRKRTFFESIKEADIMSAGATEGNMRISKLPYDTDDGEKCYKVAFATHDKLSNAWCLCSAELGVEPVVKRGPFRKDREINHIYMEDGTWHISSDLAMILGARATLGAYHLMWQLNNTEGIMPKKVSSMRIGRNPESIPGTGMYRVPNGFYSSEVSDLSGKLEKMFSEFPDSFVLLSSAEHIVSGGRVEEKGAKRESFSKKDIARDEFIVIPTSLKQSQDELIEVARMTPNAHLYEV